ncbi:hypothetical protein QQF45_06345 [Halopseudomonas aestusnigri]|uniref:hypothetical protein n=1 Tax=Halopseudomonas TaxID=2901189 RepID=UPI0022B66B64|nr:MULTISPECIES: hypothetical protein [Halopseudomonas]MDL2198686.1 hypothetical protein [Halopseudomonas aestusnigri]
MKHQRNRSLKHEDQTQSAQTINRPSDHMEQQLLLLISFALLITPVLLTRWRWFWIFCCALGIPTVLVWAQHFYVISRPEHTESPGAALGMAFLMVPTVALALGMFLRYLRWIVEVLISEHKERRSNGR